MYCAHRWGGIDVGAASDRTLAATATQHANDAGPANPCVGPDPHAVQQIGDQRRRALFPEAKLRVLVDITTPSDPAVFRVTHTTDINFPGTLAK